MIGVSRRALFAMFTFGSLASVLQIGPRKRKKFGLVDPDENPAAFVCTPYLDGRVASYVIRGNDEEGWLDVYLTTEVGEWHYFELDMQRKPQVVRQYGDVEFRFDPKVERVFLRIKEQRCRKNSQIA